MTGPADTSAAHSARKTRRKRRPLSVLSVFGELLMVAGIAVFGYLLWQPWQTGVVVVQKQAELSARDSAGWLEAAKNAQGGDLPPQSDTEPDPSADPASIPAVPKPSRPAEVFGVLYVPAFGAGYANRMAETTDWWTVLNLDDKGIGHYPETQMPGTPGNFAIAAHRSGPVITSFKEIMSLRVGDPMFVETAQGWYTYRFRNIEYVWPTDTDVIAPFPRLVGQVGTDQIMTLTTCHPKEAGSDERAVAYAVFEDYQPLTEGPPAELAKLNPDLSKQVS